MSYSMDISTFPRGVWISVSAYPTPPCQVYHLKKIQKRRSDGSSGGRPPDMSSSSLFPPSGEIFQRLFLVIEGTSIHDRHVVDAVCLSLSEVLNQRVSILFSCIQPIWWVFVVWPGHMAVSLLHSVTWVDDGFIAHV